MKKNVIITKKYIKYPIKDSSKFLVGPSAIGRRLWMFRYLSHDKNES